MATPFTPGTPPPTPTKIPGTVVAACILWMIYGGLGLIGGLAAAAISGGKAGLPQLVFAAAFVVTGVQVLLGKASQLIGSGVVCILLGVMALAIVGLASSIMPGWIGLLVMLNSALLIVAGILAIVGNGAYQRWRMTRPR